MRSLLWPRLAGLAVLVAACVAVAGCFEDTTQQAVDTKNNNSQAMALHNAEPYPVMTDSEELKNERTRYQRLNDPNKVAYIYLFAKNGGILAEYQVIGKCSSTESQYSAPAQVYFTSYGQGGSVDGYVVPAAQPDGSYGQNENALYCFLNDAQKTMIEFSGEFLWSEKRLPLTTPPSIVVVPNGGK